MSLARTRYKCRGLTPAAANAFAASMQAIVAPEAKGLQLHLSSSKELEHERHQGKKKARNPHLEKKPVEIVMVGAEKKKFWQLPPRLPPPATPVGPR